MKNTVCSLAGRFRRRGGRFGSWYAILTAAALLAGCGVIPDLHDEPEKPQEPDEKFDFIARNNSNHFAGEEDAVRPDLVGAEPGGESSELSAKAKSLSEKPAYDSASAQSTAGKIDPVLPGARQSRFYEDFILLDADSKVKVAMNFSGAPLLDVLSAFADVLEFNFTADNDLAKTTVTLNVNSTLTRRELWEAFDRMLQVVNATAFKDGQLLRITTANKLSRQSDIRIMGNGTGNSEVVIYELKYITAKEAVNQIRTFLSSSGSVQEGTRSNVVLLSDASDNIPKLKGILEVLDHPGRKEWPRAVIPCTNVLPSKVAAELSEILPVIGFTVSTASTRSETPGSIYVTGVDRLQILVTSAATEEVIKMIREWVGLLDTMDSTEEERVYVYKVANSQAAQLAQALSVIFTTQGSSLTIDTSSGNSRTQQLTTQTTKTTNTGNTGSASFTRAGTNNDLNTTTTVRSGIFTTPVRIFSDGINNRLVIRTTPRVYNMMKALLERLDTVPAQVLLQVMIVEVNLSDGKEFGVQFNASGVTGNVATDFGTNFENLNPGDGTDTGGTFYIYNPNNPEEKFAYVRALATHNKAKVISCPQLLVSSNTEAEIQIGEEVPLVKGSVTNSQSLSGVTNTYEYRSTGIIMTMTPQVTSSDLIVLNIKQEVSQAITNTITSVIDTPVIQQRTIETSMTIGNGKTMIMGGMIQEKMSDDLNTVPILGDIPYLKRLFGNTDSSMQRTEMLVLVTGYIVDEKGKIEDILQRYNNAVKDLSNFENSIADEHAKDMEREARIRKEKLEATAKEMLEAAGRKADQAVDASIEAAKTSPAPANVTAPAEGKK